MKWKLLPGLTADCSVRNRTDVSILVIDFLIDISLQMIASSFTTQICYDMFQPVTGHHQVVLQVYKMGKPR